MTRAYVSRGSALEPVREWRLTDDGVLLRARTEPAGVPELIPWESIVEVRLSDARSSNRQLYRCDLKLRGGRTFSVPSESFVSFATFENQAAAYREFLSELFPKLARQTHPPHFLRGDPAPWRIFQGCILLGGMLFLAWILILTREGETEVWPRLLGILLLLPLAFSQFAANRGGKFDPLNPPPELLPPT